MARYIGPVCRLCRREGMKLYLKGDRCFTDKCAIERRAYPPGAHGSSFRQKQSEYGGQLREKQKVRRMYGVLESQFRRLFDEASRRRGRTGENLLMLLERRLDNVVYRMGFAASRNEARQVVRHGHVTVNGHKASIPSMQIKVNDVVAVREKSRSHPGIQAAVEAARRKGTTGWVDVDMNKLTGTVMADPKREDLTLPIEEQLIVELYSR